MTDSRYALFVLDGEQRAALAVVRSLGRSGYPVHVGSAVPASLAGGSRWARSEARLPDPLAGASAYADAVARVAADRGARVLVPVAEPSWLAVLEHRDRLGDLIIPGPDLDAFRRAADKEAVLALAAGLGVAVPRQWVVRDAHDAAHVPEHAFPVVVKPARSVAGPDGRRRKVSVRYARSATELAAALTELGDDAGPFLVQQRIEGPGVGIFLLRWEGETRARFAHRRIREKPPSGGVSTCCESVAAPPGLLARSEALLAALDFTGVAMIEYKRDRRTDVDYLMEINPRFWGSLQLAIDAGVDFPHLLVELATGAHPAPVTAWALGRRSRWCLGELDHLIARLRRSPEELALPADAPSRLATVASVLAPWRPGQRSDVFRWSDPVPGIRETVAWVKALA